MLKFWSTRSPKGTPEAPPRNPASEKSTLRWSARTSPPNLPETVVLGLSTLPLSGLNVPLEGRYASMLAASVNVSVNPLNEPTDVTPNVEL